jgi:hypothetical protein
LAAAQLSIPGMFIKTARAKAMDAFLRRFPRTRPGDIRFTEPQPGYLRITDARSGIWVDFDTSAWRIRVIAVWPGPNSRPSHS